MKSLRVSAYIGYFGYSAPGSGGFHPDDTLPYPGTNVFDTNGGGGGDSLAVSFTPPAPISTTNYLAYNELYLAITNNSSNAYVALCNTLSNLNYIVLTNGSLANTNGWHTWE